MVFFRATYLDLWGVVLCVVLMSISGLFYIIAGQYFIAKLWNLLPISGYAGGIDGFRFILLPVLVERGRRASAAARAGIAPSSSRKSARTMCAPHVPRACPRCAVLFRHVLKNGMIPILTGAVVVIAAAVHGQPHHRILLRHPGLGSYTIDAIQAQDFAVVRAMVFLGSFLYIVGLILTDISYSWVDPRVRLQ